MVINTNTCTLELQQAASKPGYFPDTLHGTTLEMDHSCISNIIVGIYILLILIR